MVHFLGYNEQKSPKIPNIDNFSAQNLNVDKMITQQYFGLKVLIIVYFN